MAVSEARGTENRIARASSPSGEGNFAAPRLTKPRLQISEETPAGCDIDDSNFCVLEDEFDSGSSGPPTPITHQADERILAEGVYVDLIENPERFTGYAGDASSRVWKAIYEENCFTPVPFIDPARPTADGGSGFAPLSSLSGGMSGGLDSGTQAENEKKLFGSLAGPRDGGDEVCLEKRVFYRLISGAWHFQLNPGECFRSAEPNTCDLHTGLHASISIHICDDYLDQTTGQWVRRSLVSPPYTSLTASPCSKSGTKPSVLHY